MSVWRRNALSSRARLWKNIARCIRRLLPFTGAIRNSIRRSRRIARSLSQRVQRPILSIQLPAWKDAPRHLDIAQIAHLINELPGYDIFSISTLADDAPADQFTISRLYPALKYCLKPIRVTTTDMKDTFSVMEMAYMVAGGEEAYKEHPFLTHHYCPVVSPLTMDKLSTENVMFFAKEGLPVYPTIVPNAGLTSPMSMAGTIAQGNAEFLAAATLMQMMQGRHAIDLCHAWHGGGYAHRRVHLRRN